MAQETCSYCNKHRIEIQGNKKICSGCSKPYRNCFGSNCFPNADKDKEVVKVKMAGGWDFKRRFLGDT